jgi:hypothetical protein
MTLLNSAEDFDDFDRLTFFTEAALPAAKATQRFFNRSQLDRKPTPDFQYKGRSFVSPGAIKLNDGIDTFSDNKKHWSLN